VAYNRQLTAVKWDYCRLLSSHSVDSNTDFTQFTAHKATLLLGTLYS